MILTCFNHECRIVTNAQYIEWSIWFEKIVDLLEDDIILVGHSAPEHGVHHQNDFIDKSEKTWKFNKELFKYLLKTQESYLVEGDCILPKQVAELQLKYNKNIKCCFLSNTNN